MSKNFALFNEKDELVRFTELIRENNILIAFWASYCAPCKKELPQLVEIEKRYSRSHNIKLVLINVDGDGKEKGLPVLKAHNVSSLCLFDIYQYFESV
jgi:thiol-disulfide isomerase/thioredoxin